MARYCKFDGCTKHAKLGFDKCTWHITPAEKFASRADKRKRKYDRFVKKLTKLPAKNRKKSKIIEALLSGSPPAAAAQRPKTMLRKK